VRAFHLPLASRPAIVRYRAKPLNEGKNVTENDISVWLALFFSLTAGNQKRKRTKRQIELWTLFASHIFIQNDKATSVDSCSVVFFLSFSLLFSIFFWLFFTTVAPKLVLLTEYIDAFSHTLSRKKKETVQ
jgi:hypothetical protein